MLFLAKKEDEQFYVNPEDAKQYADKGFKIINVDTGHSLAPKEILNLKPTITEVNL